MASKPKTRGSPKAAPKEKVPKEKSQRERFIATAREIGVDESGREFEAALKRIIPPKSA